MTNDTQLYEKLQPFLKDDLHFLSASDGFALGIDYGTVRIGLALANLNEKIALPFKIIHKIQELDDIVPAKNIKVFVVGLPLQPDGTEGAIAHQVYLFVNRLIEKFSLPVIFIDEKLTSKYAEEYMDARFIRKKKQRESLDAYAAARILQKAFETK